MLLLVGSLALGTIAVAPLAVAVIGGSLGFDGRVIGVHVLQLTLYISKLHVCRQISGASQAGQRIS